MGSVPGMTCLEPFSMSEAERCVEYAVDQAGGPVYLRFVSVPWELGFEPPEAAPLVKGQGTVLRHEQNARANSGFLHLTSPCRPKFRAFWSYQR